MRVWYAFLIGLSFCLGLYAGQTLQPQSGFGDSNGVLHITLANNAIAKAVCFDAQRNVLVAAHSSDDSNIVLLKILPTGALDTNFNSSGSTPGTVSFARNGYHVTAVTADADGRLWVGLSDGPNMAIKSFNADGSENTQGAGSATLQATSGSANITTLAPISDSECCFAGGMVSDTDAGIYLGRLGQSADDFFDIGPNLPDGHYTKDVRVTDIKTVEAASSGSVSYDTILVAGVCEILDTLNNSTSMAPFWGFYTFVVSDVQSVVHVDTTLDLHMPFTFGDVKISDTGDKVYVSAVGQASSENYFVALEYDFSLTFTGSSPSLQTTSSFELSQATVVKKEEAEILYPQQVVIDNANDYIYASYLSTFDLQWNVVRFNQDTTFSVDANFGNQGVATVPASLDSGNTQSGTSFTLQFTNNSVHTGQVVTADGTVYPYSGNSSISIPNVAVGSSITVSMNSSIAGVVSTSIDLVKTGLHVTITYDKNSSQDQQDLKDKGLAHFIGIDGVLYLKDQQIFTTPNPNQMRFIGFDPSTPDSVFVQSSEFPSSTPTPPPVPENPVIPAGQGQTGNPPSPDSSFGSNGIVTDTLPAYHTAQSIAFDQHGNMVVAGRVGSGASQNVDAVFVARYGPDGSLDGTFNTTGIVYISSNTNPSNETIATSTQNNVQADTLHILDDGSIRVAGTGTWYAGSGEYVAVISITAQGALDTSDKRGVTYHNLGLTGMKVGGVVYDPNTKDTYVAVIGETGSNAYEISIARFEEDMIPDSSYTVTFSNAHVTADTTITDMHIDTQNEQLMIAGYTIEKSASPEDYSVFVAQHDLTKNASSFAFTSIDESKLPAQFLSITDVQIDTQNQRVFAVGNKQRNKVYSGVFVQGYSYTPQGSSISSLGSNLTDLAGGELEGLSNLHCTGIGFDDTYMYVLCVYDEPNHQWLVGRYTVDGMQPDTTFGTNGFYIGTDLTGSGYGLFSLQDRQVFRENRFRFALANSASPMVVVQGVYNTTNVPTPPPAPQPKPKPTPTPTPQPTPTPSNHVPLAYEADEFFIFQLVQLGDNIANLRYYLAFDDYYSYLHDLLVQDQVAVSRAQDIVTAVQMVVESALADHQARKNSDPDYNVVFNLDDLIHSLPGVTGISISPALTTTEATCVNSVLQAITKNGMYLFNLVKQG